MTSAKERTGTNGNEGIVGRIDVESPKKGFESSQSKSSCIMGSSLSSPASRHINHKKNSSTHISWADGTTMLLEIIPKTRCINESIFWENELAIHNSPQNSDFKLMLDSKIQ